MTKLIAYTRRGQSPVIRPAPRERDWMDASPQRFAYRCLPLNIANAHGWEALCPVGVRAQWSGEPGIDALTVETDAPHNLQPISHFGCGVLTFHLGCLLRTDPGIDLWVTGSPNRPKDGISPLTGVVETDWSPFSFTMNWQFTAPGEVEFEKDEPFCFFFPILRSLVTDTEPEIQRFEENPALAREFEAWESARSTFIADLKVPGTQAREEGWQRTYYRGVMPSGAPAPTEHRSRLHLRAFKAAGKVSGEK